MIRTSVIGAAGYTGAELVSLLAAHDAAAIVGLYGSASPGHNASALRRFGEVHPRFRDWITHPIEPTCMDRIVAAEPHAVFLATPHEISHALVPQLLDHNIVVFDLSGAFRLADRTDYATHYGFEHAHPELLQRAVYGLPEQNAGELNRADLISLPGCYPTSIILPLLPLLNAGALDKAQPIIADSTSGISGAGRSPALKSMFCEVSAQPYGVLSHRHVPEINRFTGADVIFTPHLGPFDRGILSTIHAPLAAGWDEVKVRSLLHEAYDHEPFIRLLPPGQWPSVGAVRNTNYCDIAVAVRATSPNGRDAVAGFAEMRLILFSAIDNLLKGAAGQAVQCFNIRFGLPHAAGLLPTQKDAACAAT